MTHFTSLKRRFGLRIAAVLLALGVLFPVGAAMAIPTTQVGAMKTECFVLNSDQWWGLTGQWSDYGGMYCIRK